MAADIDEKQLVATFISLLVPLLSYYEKYKDDETALSVLKSSFKEFLIEKNNLESDLATKMTEIIIRAYKESKGDSDKYMRLCIEYSKQLSQNGTVSSQQKKAWQFWK